MLKDFTILVSSMIFSFGPHKVNDTLTFDQLVKYFSNSNNFENFIQKYPVNNPAIAEYINFNISSIFLLSAETSSFCTRPSLLNLKVPDLSSSTRLFSPPLCPPSLTEPLYCFVSPNVSEISLAAFLRCICCYNILAKLLNDSFNTLSHIRISTRNI
jgi:hypothetical protein